MTVSDSQAMLEATEALNQATAPARLDGGVIVVNAAGDERAKQRARLTATGPSDLYRKSRLLDGLSHVDAVARLAQVYPNTPQELEEQPWLSPTREQVEAELAAPSSEPVAEPEVAPDELTLLATDAERRLVELREQQQRLSLDALTDEDARQELANVESEISAADAELARIPLAREERQRRDAEAQAQAEAEALSKARERERKLRRQLQEAGRRCDEAMAAAAEAIATYSDVFLTHHESAVASGERPWGRGGSPSPAIAGAMRHHLARAGSGRMVNLADPAPERPLASPAK